MPYTKTIYENGICYTLSEPGIMPGDQRWYLYGKQIIHRELGPAMILYGDKYWYRNNKIHRIDGPAIEYKNGSKKWYLNGKCHRLDGPAIEYADGYKEWYIEGELIDCKSQEEFDRLIKLKAFW